MKFIVKYKKWLILVLLIFIFLSLSSDKKQEASIPDDTKAVVAKPVPTQVTTNTEVLQHDKRLLGMSISDGKIGFEKSFALAQSVGVSVVEIPVFWDESESSVGKFESKWLSLANQFYPAHHTKISLTIDPIDTNNLRMPKDLKDKAFNDPEVIARGPGGKIRLRNRQRIW